MNIYAWGYGHEVWEMLQGVKAFVANDGYMSAIAIAIMLFMLMIRFLNVGQVDWKMFLVSLLAVSVFLKPSTMTFNIVDEATGYGSTVSNIPVGLGVLLALESQIEKAMLQKVESSFSTPTGVSLQKAGMGFSFIAPLEMMHANPTDKYLQLTFTHWMNNCFLYDIAQGNTDLNNVVNATDIIANLAPTVRFETLVFSTANPQGIEQDCQTAYNTIKTKLGTEANTYLTSVLPQKLNMVGSSNLAGALTDTQTLIHQASANSAKWVEQEMMRNMLDKGFKATATMTGGELASTAWSAAVAKAATNQTWRMTGEQAKNNLPVVRAIGTSLLIGVSVIVAFFAIASLNFKALFMVFAGFITLGLWSPIAALINYQVYRRAQDALSTGFGTLANTDIGLEQIATYTANLEWWYGAIPMISYMLVTGGGMGAMYLLRDAGAGSGAGSGAGIEASRGNIAHGNTNVDNTTMSEKRANHENFVDAYGVHSNLDTVDGIRSESTVRDTYGGVSIGKTLSSSGSMTTSVNGGATGSSEVNTDSDGNITSAVYNNPNSSRTLSNVSSVAMSSAKEEMDSATESYADKLSSSIQSLESSGINVSDTEALQASTGLNHSVSNSVTQAESKAKTRAFVDSLSEEQSKEIGITSGGKAEAYAKGEVRAGGILGTIVGVEASTGGKVTGYTISDSSTGEKSSHKLQNTNGSNFQESLTKARVDTYKEDENLLKSISQSVTSGTAHLNSVGKNDAKEYSNSVSHMESVKKSLQNTHSFSNDTMKKIDNLAMENYLNETYGERWKNGSDSIRKSMQASAMSEFKRFDEGKTDAYEKEKISDAYTEAIEKMSYQKKNDIEFYTPGGGDEPSIEDINNGNVVAANYDSNITSPNIHQHKISNPDFIRGTRSESDITGIVWHNTAGGKNISYSNAEKNGYGTHYWIAGNGEITQTAKDNQIVYHTGSNKSSTPHGGILSSSHNIGVEVASSYDEKTGKWSKYSDAQIESIEKLTKYLTEKHNNIKNMYHHGDQDKYYKTKGEGEEALKIAKSVLEKKDK